MQADDLEYKTLLILSQKHLEKGRPESAAFLNWFLENIYNLDDVQADDTICDGQYDQGIDGIYVNEIDQEIVFFQAKLTQNPKKTLGDVALKEFAGSLGQFDTPEKAESVANTTKNPELKKILDRIGIGPLVSGGFGIRGVFVTNSAADENAEAYLKRHPQIALYDRSRIASEYVDIDAPPKVSWELRGYHSFKPQ